MLSRGVVRIRKIPIINLSNDKCTVYTDHSASSISLQESDSKAEIAPMLFDVVFLAKKPKTSSWLATMVPPVDITVLSTQQEKSSISDSFGPLSTKMPMSWFKEKFHNGMRCHKIPSKFVKSLTYGALTLWGHSRHPKATNTSSWPLIIYQNGLKQKCSPPMMRELFVSFLNLSSPDLVPLVQS
ncbi:hypothetical protein Tco_1038516 [Tanacetum coccineum]